MNRVIKLAVDGSITELSLGSFNISDIDKLLGEGNMIERVKVARLTDKFEPTETKDAFRVVPVILVDESGLLKSLPYNENATRLYAPLPERHRYYLTGDAYVVGEGMTNDGPDFTDLPEAVTVEALAELVAYFEDH